MKIDFSRFAWPTEADVPPKPNKKRGEEKRVKRELAKLQKKWVLILVGAVIAVPVGMFVLTALYGIFTVGSRLQFPSDSQSPSVFTQPTQSGTTSTQGVEVSLEAGETKPAVGIGPDIAWTIQSNKPFVAWAVASKTNAPGQAHQMPAGASGWGGAVTEGSLMVRGVEDDTRIKFFRQ